MNHFTTAAFWSAFEELPEPVQAMARKNFDLLKADPQHPSLKLKRVGRYWSVRVGLRYRALSVEDSGDLVWF